MMSPLRLTRLVLAHVRGQLVKLDHSQELVLPEPP